MQRKYLGQGYYNYPRCLSWTSFKMLIISCKLSFNGSKTTKGNKHTNINIYWYSNAMYNLGNKKYSIYIYIYSSRISGIIVKVLHLFCHCIGVYTFNRWWNPGLYVARYNPTSQGGRGLCGTNQIYNSPLA